MMGLFSKLGFGKDNEEITRTLEHPGQLEIGDMIKFSFAEQSLISNRTFNVERIWTLDLGGDRNKRCYLKLADLDDYLRLRVIDGQNVELGMKILPDTLLDLFNQDDIVALLDPDSGTQHLLERISEEKNLPEFLHGWTAPSYRQEGFELAYRYEEDYRKRPLPEHQGEGEEGCDFAWLVSDDRNHSLEFRVFDGGRTEVHLCTILPQRKIEELWPGQ